VFRLTKRANHAYRSQRNYSQKFAKLSKKTQEKAGPREADIEGVIDEHLAGSLGLRFALLGEDGEIGAPLDPTFLVPGALAVPHEHHPLSRPYPWKPRRRIRHRTQSPRLFHWLLLLDLLHARRR